MKVRRNAGHSAVCNLCGQKFRRKSVFIRYCDTCRKKSAVYRFAESFAICSDPFDSGDVGDLFGYAALEQFA